MNEHVNKERKILVNLKVVVVDFVLRLFYNSLAELSLSSPFSLLHDKFTRKSCNLITDNHHQTCQWDEFGIEHEHIVLIHAL